ncbi:MAG: DUF58 domain-containing protein [Deltaproteobacteria bacterium]|nr:MAG: DUF58 domain-containing protein [Deltaproteobacteria bacterium]
MIPTRRLVLLLTVPLVTAIGVYFLDGLIVLVLALDLVIAIVAAADLLLNLGVVVATREAGRVQSVGRPFEVTVELANPGRRALLVEVEDDAPGERDGLPVAVDLPSGRRAAVSYEARIDRRGEHHFGNVIVRWTSPLGLWQRQRHLEVDTSVRVYPDFGALRQYGLSAPAGSQRAPVRARRRPGGENEFERLRPYVAGDPYRHIDWKATARRRQFISREFGQESNQNVVFLLDAGRLMTGTSDGLTLFDRALNSALMMAHVALKHGDRVGMLVFDSEVRAWLPPASGSKSAHRLIRGTYDVFAREEEPDYALAFRYLGQRLRSRSLVVLLTTVVDEVNANMADAVVSGLARRHLPMVVWLRDQDVDHMLHAPAAAPVDHYGRGAAAELLTWREAALGKLRQRGALVLDADPEELTPGLLGRYLEVKARRLL